MQKQTVNKKVIICAAAAVLIVAAVAALFLFRGDEAFRSIMVYELEGSAVIDRAEIGTINATENLYLESGDRVSVADESMMRMKLDDDKYVTAEADTVFALEAEGDGDNSRTRIRLEQGAVTNEIQKPLGGEDLYETTTPNSVMAVRGTIYRVQLSDDGAGGQDMRLCCFDGTVAAKPILPDGTYGEEVLVHAGSELTIYSDGTVAAVKEIDFESLPKQALEVLRSLMESGASVTGITADVLNSFMTVAGDAGEETASDGADETEGTDSQAASSITEGFQGDTESDEALQAEEDSDGADGQNLAAGRNKKKADQGKDGSTKKESGTGKDSEPAGGKEPGEPGTPAAGAGSSGSENTGSSGSDSSNSNNGGSGNNGSGDGDSGKPSGDGNSGDDSQDQKPGDDSGSKPNPPKETTYTVTYKYQGTVFATQTVKSGRKAAAPVLAPAAEGAWDFDFDTKIKADTTIQWKP